jgi:predicted DNA repair protein MutK
MAATSLLTLLDDIAGLLDDVAALTKIATRKTAGVLGDDLALNAQQLTGLAAHRELPVVWAVMKGSFVNKSILVPGALLVSAFLPWAVTPLLMLGGVFLCYEGCEKLAHRFLHAPQEDRAQRMALTRSLSDPAVDVLQLERDRIKGAVRTDFILSAEIIAITLGAVAAAPLLTQVLVLSGIALLMTIGVYGFVAGVVKLDDAGLYLLRSAGEEPSARAQRRLGGAILAATPWLMKGLSVAGTAAMFLVGGGILVHGIPWLQHAVEAGMQRAAAAPGFGPALSVLAEMLVNAVVGILAGALVLAAIGVAHRLRRPKVA